MRLELPADWALALQDALNAPSFRKLGERLALERAAHAVFPPADEVFTALRLTPLNSVRVVLLGQDPYHDDGQAHGLAFSVRDGVRIPPSLRNLLRELGSDIPRDDGTAAIVHGDLTGWARQGVLLLNTVLTVRAHEPASHQRLGWEPFTDAVIRAVAELPHVAFLLLGAHAQVKAKLLDPRHSVLRHAHPSPLSARKFFGSKPFSAVNTTLLAHGQPPVDWYAR